ncbi:hypothetical protein PR202_ga18032 [Eleusine coracana subsp. coracana]|uniref:Uncharacterized protein n=1 Tax=Eleusine coracana subsp. coracana TaxID=191504 RepID=A0AAV5CS06_ELECO|nr:hypothetical protein PR202_ga18032 [Eleusine coracana subsp. coracana]
MFGAGGSTSTAIKCMRIHCHKAPEKALSFTLLKAIKVQPPGWKKQALLQKTSKNLKSISSNLLKQLVDTAYRFSEQPSLNEGNFGPVNEIGAAVLLKHIDGEIPEEFPEGAYIRNGPNPLNPTQTIADSIVGSTSYLYYEGHGMLHAVHFNKSSLGEWEISYQKKYVASDTFQLEREKNEVTFLPAADGQPYATLAAFVLNMVLITSMEPGINLSPVIQRYNIIMDYPLKFGILRTLLQKPFIENDMNGKSRIGVMPRFGNAESIIWFNVENHCSYHLFNCFEEGNEVVVRGCRTIGSVIPSSRHRADKSKSYGRAFLQPDRDSNDFDPSIDGTLFSRPYEWRLSLKNGTTNEGYITSEKVAMDFPAINDKFIGVRNKYGYAQVVDSLASCKTGLFKYNMIAKLHFDVQDKENRELILVEYHVLEEKHFCSGVQFVAKENGIDEDDGWVVTYVHNEGTDTSQVYIIDAKRFSEEPVAKVTLTQRVPYGFHGNFFYK